MRKRLWNRFILLTVTGAICIMCIGENVFIKDARAFTARSGTVDVSRLNVRSSAGMGNNTITTLSRDTTVMVLDEVNSGGMYWYKISFNTGSGEREGYVAKSYIRTNAITTYTLDRNFESDISAFPESYKEKLRALHAEYPNWKFVARNVDIPWDEIIENEAVVGRNLVSKSAKSSWKSTAKGAYNWDNATWPGFDSSEWVAASEEIIRYYMDPRNFLDSTNIFQFLHHGYTSTEQTAEGVEKMLKGTFMESKSSIPSQSSAATESSTCDPNIKFESPAKGPGSEELSGPTMPTEPPTTQQMENENLGPGYTNPAPLTQPEITTEFNDSEHGPGVVNNDSIKESLSSAGSVYLPPDYTKETQNSMALSNGTSYVDMIMDAAKSSGVNPYVISAMLIQEQGVQGKSGLISGSGGIYNFFNIEAYQSGSQTATQRGLAWAGSGNTYMRPWNTKAKAIIGGAMYYGSNYLKAGQDSFYLKKFNVLGANRYKHQYMTNIEGAKNEGARLSMAYSESDKQGQFTFFIPVYREMPDVPEIMPSGDGSPNNRLNSLSVSGYNITPAFSKDNYSYTLELPANVSNINVNAVAANANAEVSGNGNIDLDSSKTSIDIVVKAQNGTRRKYSIQIKR